MQSLNNAFNAMIFLLKMKQIKKLKKRTVK